MNASVAKADKALVESLFAVGAHLGYSKSRRHPSLGKVIFGLKNKSEIIDLEETARYLDVAKEFARSLGAARKPLLFVTSKNEAKEVGRTAAESIRMPMVIGRWIGGSLTNFPEIKKRIDRLAFLKKEGETGGLAKYTKKERLLLEREVAKLERNFGGISSVTSAPGALFVIDPKKEAIAVTEAHKVNIPVIAVLNTDCDLRSVEYPIPGNDALKASVEFFTKEIVAAYREGEKQAALPTPPVEETLATA